MGLLLERLLLEKGYAMVNPSDSMLPLQASTLQVDAAVKDSEGEMPGQALDPMAWLKSADSLTPHQALQVAPAVLAYVGDAVFELHVRLQYLHPPRRIQTFHQQVVAQVRAETQAQQLLSLASLLTEAEQDIVRRGRNAATGKPKRLSIEIYRQATGFEALLGYLYLTQGDRLSYLLAQLDFSVD